VAINYLPQYRTTTGPGPWIDVISASPFETPNTAITATGLTPSTSYDFRILADNGSGVTTTSAITTAVTAAAVAGSLTLLSYPLTAGTNGKVALTGSYTGTSITQPTAAWSGGSTATVTGWVASNGQWSCAIATPTTATGTMTFTIGNVTSANVTVTAQPFDFAPGLYFPTTFAWGQGNINNTTLGSYLLRGFTGQPVVTITGVDAALFTLNTNSNQISNGPNLFMNTSKSQFQFTLTATDGTLTSSVNVTVVNPIDGIPTYTLGTNVILDSAPVFFTGLYVIGFMRFWQASGAFSFVDPSGLIVWDSNNQAFCLTQANLNKYGSYPITINIGSQVYHTTLYIAHERPPVAAWVQAIKVFNNTPALSMIGNVSFFADAPSTNNGQNGLMTLQVPTNPSPGLYVSVNGVVELINAPTTGNYTFVISIASGAGASLLQVTIPVTTGITLPATNITHTALPTLDNSMAALALPGGIVATPLLLTTLAVSGFTNTPTWSIAVTTATGGPENCQTNSPNSYIWGNVPPRYTFNGPIYSIPLQLSGVTIQRTATGVSNIKLYASYLSAQTDNVYITVDDGLGTRCTLLIPVVVAAKIGPNVNVGPGQTFTTFDAFTQAYWQNRPTYFGAVVTLFPGVVATTDFRYSNQAGASSGYVNGWAAGPLTIKSPPGTVRTVLNFGDNTNGSQQAGLVCANFDLTLINLEITGVSASGSGEPNAGGVYMTGTIPGNLTMSGCYIYNCDMGVMNGDGSARHVSIDSCLFERNGTGSGPGTDHNIYISTISGFTFSNSQSDASTDDHCIKSRAMVTTITNSKFRQGAQAVGSGCPVDCPLGGIVSVSNCIITSSNEPGNEFMVEAGEENGPGLFVWPQSSTLVTGCTFYNLTAPQAHAIIAIADYTSVGPQDGSPLITTYSNNQFYNIPHANWTGIAFNGYPGYYSGATFPPVDGGGNTALTTYTKQSVIDPLTGIRPIHQPMVAFIGITPGHGPVTLQSSDSLQLDFVCPTAPPINTLICTLLGYDNWNGLTFTGSITYAIVTNPGNLFSYVSGQVKTATSSTPDGLYFLQLSATGTGVSNGTSQTLNATQWVPIVVGNGFVAAS
jgi:hypothetical protein